MTVGSSDPTLGRRRGSVIDHQRRGDRLPQRGARPVGIGGVQPVSDHDPFDHVGKHCWPWSIAHPNRDDGGSRLARRRPTTPDTSIDTNEARRRTKTRCLQTHRAGGRAENLHRPRELKTPVRRPQRRGSASTGGASGSRMHVDIMNKGCDAQTETHGLGRVRPWRPHH